MPTDEVEVVETPTLSDYEAQAIVLRDALQAVKRLQEEIASLIMRRDTVASQREKFLADWTETESDWDINELSLLDSRAAAFEAKRQQLVSQQGKAQETLREALFVFANSVRGLYGYMSVFVKEKVIAQVTELVDPALRVSHKSYIVDFAQLHSEVTTIQPLEIREAQWINENSHPDDVFRASEQVLSRVEPLFNEAARRLEEGFVPPAPWSREAWYKSIGTSREQFELEQKRRAEREAAEKAQRVAAWNALHPTPLVETM
jgi:hypothetical protein